MAIRIEYIPDKDNVFRNIHKNFLNPETGPQNKIIPAAVFHLHKDEDGLSVNWDKYCPTARHSIELSLSPREICCCYCLFEYLFKKFNTEIVVISEIGNEKLDSQEIFEEIVSLLHCYSMKLYSSRKKKKIQELIEKEVK